MASNIFRKRVKKWRGFGWWLYSWILWRYTTLNKNSLQEKIHRQKLRKWHVGCGNVLLAGWLNIRFDRREEYGRLKTERGKWLLNYNLLRPWPTSDGALDFIAGSHFIEHLDLNGGLAFARKCFAALNPGGTLRLSCPDLEIYATRYIKRDMDFFNHPKIREWCTFAKAKTPGEIFIAKAYDSGGSHQWFYDFESLKHVLESAGFADVKKVGRLQGRTPDLSVIEPAEREMETLFVEAVKPR